MCDFYLKSPLIDLTPLFLMYFFKKILYSEKCKGLCKLVFETAVIPAANTFGEEFRECSESSSERSLAISTGMWS